MCQAAQEIAMIILWKNEGYNVHQCFLFIKNNNEIVLYFDYLIQQLNKYEAQLSLFSDSTTVNAIGNLWFYASHAHFTKRVRKYFRIKWVPCTRNALLK